MTDHSTLTDPDLHEPKGVSTAPANSVYVATGTGTGFWELLPTPDIALVGVKIGSVIFYAGSTAPSRWAFCGGQELDRGTYSELFELIDTTYGAGNGSTTFNVPDIRGRAIAGRDNMGGSPANRLHTAINGAQLGAAGGSQQVTLALSNLPPIPVSFNTTGNHNHPIEHTSNPFRAQSGQSFVPPTSGGGRMLINRQNRTLGAAGNHNHTVTMNPGGGQPHINTQPILILNAIIYHGVE